LLLADAEQKLAVSRTDFADLWRRAVQHNPYVQAFMLNFGAIGEALVELQYILS
jgi:hypothetical protein